MAIEQQTKPRPTRFGLIRHAETRWNREGRIQGQGDSPLTDRGRAQAESWGKWLQPLGLDRILASDLGRVGQTLEIINRQLNLPVDRDRRLRELSWGRWEGRTISELKKEHTGDQWEALSNRGWEFQPPGGEDRQSHFKRCSRALMDAGKAHPGETVLVIAHGGVLKALCYHLSGRMFLPSEPELLFGYHLHWLTVHEGSLRIDRLNAVDLSGKKESPGPEKEPETA